MSECVTRSAGWAVAFILVAFMYLGTNVYAVPERPPSRPVCFIKKMVEVKPKTETGFAFEQGQVKAIVKRHGDEVLDLVDASERFFSCIDARNENPVIGAFGGDIGEFLLGLDTYRAMCMAKREVDDDRVYSLMKEFIKEHITPQRPFYMHTDDTRMKDLLEAMDADAFPQNEPDAVVKQKWFDLLLQSHTRYHGCGHLWNIMSHTDEYGTSLEMIQSALKAFFTLYWSSKYSDRVHYGLMFGSYHAQALMMIETYPAADDSESEEKAFAHSLRGAVTDLKNKHHDQAIREEQRENQELPCEDQVVPVHPRYCASGCAPKDVRGFSRSAGFVNPPELDVFVYHRTAVERFRALVITPFFQQRCKGRATRKEFLTMLSLTSERWQALTLKHLKATSNEIPHLALKIELDVRKPLENSKIEGKGLQ